MGRFALVLPIILLFSLFAQVPYEEGPYSVGCRIRTIERPSDTDTSTRVMDNYIWYPAISGTGYWFESLNAYVGATPLGDSLRPVVFCSHGGCGHPLASVYYTSFLPSWGMICVATMHPGSMYGEPDCLDSASLHDTWLNRPGDVEFTREWLIQTSLDSSELFGDVDTTRMAMTGHSFGARTTYAMLNRTSYFCCGVGFSGDYTDVGSAPINCLDDIRGIDVPIMIQNGTYDFGLESVHAQEIYDTLGTPKFWIEIQGASHFSWADTCNDEMDPFCGIDSVLDYYSAHKVILKYTISFLFKYLLNNDIFDSYLTDTTDSLTDVFYDFPVGVSENKSRSEGSTLSIYPNPFNGELHISLKHGNKVEIYNIDGHLIESFASGKQNLTWRPNNCSSGIYLIKISDSKEVKKCILMN